MIKNLKLCVVIQFYKLLELKISELNSRIKQNEELRENKELTDYKESLKKQLIRTKLAKEKGNQKKHGFLGIFGKSNSQYIFDLSELKRELDHKKSLVQNKLTKHNIQELEKQKKSIEKKLELFNRNQTVLLYVSKDLIPILKECIIKAS